MDMGRGDQKLRTGFFNLLISSCRYVINLIFWKTYVQITFEGWSLGVATFGPTIVKMQNKISNKSSPNSLLPLHFCFQWDLIGTWSVYGVLPISGGNRPGVWWPFSKILFSIH